MTPLTVKLVLSFLLLLASAGFSCAETAFLSLSRIQLGRLRKAHPGRLDFWEEDPDRVLAVLLLGNSLTNVGLGVLSTGMALDLERLWGVPFRWGGWLVPAAVTLLVIVFGEIIPKVLARNYSEPAALALAGPVRGLARFLGPLLQGLLDRIGGLLSWLSRTIRAERGEWSAPVIRSLLQNAPLGPRLRSVLSNLLEFGNLPVSRVMVPRPEIFSVNLALPKREFIQKIMASGYSRVPVHRGSPDHIEGVVYAKDLLTFWRNESLLVVEDLVRPALRVAADTPLAHLLREFRQGRNHLALVIDRTGPLQGLVTLQDVLEAIVGEIGEEPAAPSRPAYGLNVGTAPKSKDGAGAGLAADAAGLRDLLARGDYRGLARRLEAAGPSEIAAGWSAFSLRERIIFFKLLSPAGQDALFGRLDPADRLFALETLERGALGPVLEGMGPGEADALFPRPPEETVRRWIALLKG